LDGIMKPILQTLTAATLAVLTLCLAAPQAFAQLASDLVGSWTLVSFTVVRSGSEVEVLGPHPHGQLIFGSDGRYVIVGLRADLPKFAADNRLSGSAEDNQRIVQGSFAHFGTYTVDSSGHVIVFHIQNSTFPNWDGDVQRRPFTLDGERLTYVTPGSFGYGASKVSWQRME
jgi:Lipocalin-like domain